MKEHISYLLLLVVVDDILVGRTALVESVQLVLVAQIPPEVGQLRADLELSEVFACTHDKDDNDMR